MFISNDYTLFFYKQHFYKERQAETGKKSSKYKFTFFLQAVNQD